VSLRIVLREKREFKAKKWKKEIRAGIEPGRQKKRGKKTDKILGILALEAF
jgi:hypothetical protein